MAKLSFKVSWLQDEEMFLVKQMSDGVVEEEHKFEFHGDAMEYISNTMGMCQTCQEDWTFTY
jgi:hypothetical protein